MILYPSFDQMWLRRFLAWLLVVVLCTSALGADEKRLFDVPAGDASEMLKKFAQQANHQIVYPAHEVAGIKTAEVKGHFTAKRALEHMLGGTNLVAKFDERTGTIAVNRDSSPNGRRAAPASDRPGTNGEDYAEKKVILETFEVFGSKTLNMDIPRSRDGTQPYVVFDRRAIEDSGAVTVEEFLKTRLTMNTQGASTSQSADTRGPASQVNLRGLGANQTLLLIDGHRLPSLNANGTPQQSDLNGIPASAIERIEVLPTTASGIYGGSATGGVINIILRRDYSGAEAQLYYENTFESDAPIRRFDLSAGLNLEGGKTHVLFVGSVSDNAGLVIGERDLYRRGRATIYANNPGFYLNATNPPLGSTANIRSANGSPLFGPGTSNITFVPVGYAGGGGLAPLQANAGRYNFELAPTAQNHGGTRSALLNGPRVESAMMSVRRDFGDRINAFIEGSAANNTGEFPLTGLSGAFAYTLAAGAPNNPFGQAVLVNTPIATADGALQTAVYTRRVVAGAIVKLPADWKAGADYTWTSLRYGFVLFPTLSAAATTAINSGTINVLRDRAGVFPELDAFLVPTLGYTLPFRTTMRSVTGRAGGPVGSWRYGRPALSVAVEDRNESYDDAMQITSAGAKLFPGREQSAQSAYAELRVPLLAELPMVRLLELQASGRYEMYEMEGTTNNTPAATPAIARATLQRESFDPSVGVRYEPVAGLALRASYGTGFLPPGINLLVPGNPGTTGSGTAVDPLRGNTRTVPFQSISGGNPNLRPEESESFSVGIVVAPERLFGWRLSLDYTSITKTDNIQTLSIQQLIDNEALFPGRIVRGPKLAGDDPSWSGPITFLNRTSINASRAEVEAYDVQVDRSFALPGAAELDFFGMATWQTHFRTQLLETAPITEGVGIGNANPLKFKANASVTYRRGAWKLGWLSRYFDSYLVADPASATSAVLYLNQGGREVPAQIFHDAFVSFRFDKHSDGWRRWLGRSELQLGVKNVFNKEPAFDAANTLFLYSPYGDPRMGSYYVSLRTQF